MTDDRQAARLDREGAEALSLMERALVLLDLCDPAGHVAPHLDLAISRLYSLTGRPRPSAELEE
jgi:hypothetical protein